MCIVGGRCYFFEHSIAVNLRAAGFLRKPAEERIALAGRFGGQVQRFAVGLVGSFRFAGTEIPCDLVFCRGKLRVKCPRGCDRDRAVQHAACLFCVPAGERVTGLDRRVTGSNGGLVGRDGGRHAVLATNRAAVGRGVPRHDQRDICATIITDTHTVRETRMVLRGNLQYIQRDIGYIEKMVAHGVSLSLLGDDLYRKLLVIQELCRQQWDMYVRKSHQIEDRIVSIDQPHVRPIVRGKAGCPTEFGAKVIVGLVGGYAFLMKADWNNYSESRSLKRVVEEYKETFGFYPKTILADRAYPGRENRLWCTSLGIRLSGPRLGRKSAEEEQAESKQIYQDSCDRVVIEGTFGVVKRRYSLDRVMARLPDTSMTSISMGFFAANMERKLRLLFAPECGWALDYDFDLGELVIFPRFPDVPAIQ